MNRGHLGIEKSHIQTNQIGTLHDLFINSISCFYELIFRHKTAFSKYFTKHIRMFSMATILDSNLINVHL